MLLALAFVIRHSGAGSYSINHWLGVSNWAGIDWSMSPDGRAAIALEIGMGLATALLGYLTRSAPGRTGVAATS